VEERRGDTSEESGQVIERWRQGDERDAQGSSDRAPRDARERRRGAERRKRKRRRKRKSQSQRVSELEHLSRLHRGVSELDELSGARLARGEVRFGAFGEDVLPVCGGRQGEIGQVTVVPDPVRPVSSFVVGRAHRMSPSDSSSPRSAFLPRDTQVATVPMGTPRRRVISSYPTPSR